jgi:hypothetical protein
MRVQKREGSSEREILTAMIVEKRVLSRIVPKWDKDMFNARWSNIIGQWCVDFYKKYDKAPGKAVVGLFEAWADKADKETITLVEKFLDRLSGDYAAAKEGINIEYMVDRAAVLFNKVRLARLADAIQGDLDNGDIQDALDRVQNKFKRVEIGAGVGIDVLTDQAAIERAFTDKREQLIEYPDPLGRFFGDSLERDAFVSFMAPEKTGKSWWLQDMGVRGVLQHRKVALFQVGDLSEAQQIRRLITRFSRRPIKARTYNYPTKITRADGEQNAEVELDERKSEVELDWREALKDIDKFRKKTKSRQSLLKLSVHPADTLSVHGMRAVLDTWERDGWTPDVVVVDYADILAPPSGVQDGRDQINKTWAQMRAISQLYHCLVVTATQSDAGSYYARTLGKGNFTNDKRKLAHVTGMIGINQTEEEKELQVFRLNWVALREDEFVGNRCIHVASCLAIANPAIRSCW